MKRQKAKGKRQKANVAAPDQPLPEGQPLEEESVVQKHNQSVDDPTTSSTVALPTITPSVEAVDSAQVSVTAYERVVHFIARHGVLAVVIFATLLSLASFVYLFTNGMTNHYGDGIAHVNIARKVVDSPDASLWQRYLQIGTPWLPMQTVLMLPLVAIDPLWRSGAAGSLVSMIAFVVAATMIYQIAWRLYGERDAESGKWMAAVALLIFALNPSALFMQATPMTELIFMAALAAAVFCLQQWVKQQSTRRLVVAGMVMTLATLARYEAWPVAALSVLIVALASRGDRRARLRMTALFAALVCTGPLYWLWHNWAIFGNALEFLSGPHSARGIFLHEEARLGWAKVFIGHPLTSLLWMAVTTAVCSGPFVLLIGAVGFITFITLKRRALIEQAPALLLAVPFLFHTFSVMRGEIQIFPFSAFGLLNVRYGLPHLLAVAAFAPAVIWLFNAQRRRSALIGLAAVVVLQYGYLISEGPSQLAVYQEGYRNGVNSARAREWAHAAAWLRANPPRQMVWMNTGALGPLVPRGGLQFSNIIHEGSLRWHTINGAIPTDVKTIIYQEGDPLAERIKTDAAIAGDFGSHFEQQFAYDSIRIFTRKE